jgi:hypothetical protein
MMVSANSRAMTAGMAALPVDLAVLGKAEHRADQLLEATEVKLIRATRLVDLDQNVRLNDITGIPAVMRNASLHRRRLALAQALHLPSNPGL